MALTRPLLLCSALVLAGCGGLSNSVVNPMNWFGRSTSTETAANTNALIPPPSITERPKVSYQGQLIDQITSLRIERRPGGALILAEGLGDVVGYYDVRLVAENDGEAVDGVLSYEFKAVRPSTTVGVGPERSRKLLAARTLTDQDLAGVRRITVKAARNQSSSRR